MKNIGFFSTGIPDPNQGGSGIFNYYLLKRLIEKKNKIDVFLRVNKSFLKNHSNSKFLNSIKDNLNSINFIYEDNIKIKKLNFFYSHLADVHYVKKSLEVINNIKKKYDAHISLDLGWAISLAQTKKNNCISVLGDPYHARVLNSFHSSIFSLKNNFLKLRAYSTCLSSELKKINNLIIQNKNFYIGSFSKQHAEEYSLKGLNCQELSWFSPFVEEKNMNIEKVNNDFFTLTHMGDLGTTASKMNLIFLLNSLKILSQALNRIIKIKFIGRFKKKLKSPYRNIIFEYTGYLENIDHELSSSDATISVSNYPVGTRTRILSSLSYGVPCIAHKSASLGLHKLIHKKHILFCDSPLTFADCVLLLINNKNLSNEISKESRKIWLQEFNPLINVDKILNIINC